MARRRRTYFGDAAGMQLALFNFYFNQLFEIAISMFKWMNLPDTVDPRFLELTLFNQGQAVFFRDEVLGELAMQVLANGPFNVYSIPVNRRAVASNSYQKELNINDSVIIYNNYSRVATAPPIRIFATRLANLDMTIDVNVNAQKTPILLVCDENERLTLENLYMSYQGNEPLIKGTRALRPDSLKVLKTDAPYTADKLAYLRTSIWNDALSYLGIPNVPYQKRERLVSEEVTQAAGGTMANRLGRLNARKDACRQINEMFGLNIDCEYNANINDLINLPGNQGDDVSRETSPAEVE